MRSVAIVVAYVTVFGLLLPFGLWTAGSRLDRRLHLAGSPSAAGAVLVALGVAGMAWSMAELWRRGRGLPISALPPRFLARSGPYRFVRHPIYLSFNVAVLGAGLAFGSPGLAYLVAPAFLPAWLLYARVEERGLLRRFGPDYRRYRRRVGVFPRAGPAGLVKSLGSRGAFGARRQGTSRLPDRGPFVVVCNHCCVLDSLYCFGLTSLPLRFLVTAELHRRPLTRWPAERLGGIPIRRYRPDPAAYREVVRSLSEGAVVGIAPEGERSPWGDYQGARPDVAGVLARLGVPVIPVGLNGNYDCGPRWAGVLRRRPVSVRVGPPIDWDGRDPASAVDTAIRALLDVDPQPLHLAGLPRERLERALWRCPACGDEPGWRALRMSCSTCGAAYRPTPDGRLVDEPGNRVTFGDLGRLLKAMPERHPLAAPAAAAHEPSTMGPIRPLRPMGTGTLEASPEGLRFASWTLPIERIRSVSTERDDTLQVATREEMWQFRIRRGSAFRFHRALERWACDLPQHPCRPYPNSRLHSSLIVA